MTSFAQSCQELMDNYTIFKKRSTHMLIDEKRRERQIRAEEEVAFLKEVQSYLYSIEPDGRSSLKHSEQLDHKIFRRIADLQEGIKILEGTS